jgi:hypothetical protein
MAKQYQEITPEIRGWLSEQRLFFVATAPSSLTGLVNCSPKGMDTFRVLAPKEVGYVDLTGSGIETAAHLRENGRIVIMFCALSGPPKIVRFHGIGSYCVPGSPEFTEVSDRFTLLPGTRGIVRCQVSRISESCGFSIPRYEFEEERDTLLRWAESKGATEIVKYHESKNATSIDGLPGRPS